MDLGSGRVARTRVLGTIRLVNAEVGGGFEFDRASLAGADYALLADNAKIAGDVFFRSLPDVRAPMVVCKIVGTISFLHADIKGAFMCTGARLVARGGVALTLEGAAVNGFVQLSADGPTRSGAVTALVVRGSVILNSARIRSD